MKLAKYKRYLRLAQANEGDIRYIPFVVIEQEMSIEEARRRFPPMPEVPQQLFKSADLLRMRAEAETGAAAFRREYLGEWEVPKYFAPPATREQAAEGIKRSFDKIALDLGRDNLRFHGSRGGGNTEAMRRLTAAQPSQSNGQDAPAAHTLPAVPPETV